MVRSLKATERTRSRETVYYSPLRQARDTTEDDSEETDELLRLFKVDLKMGLRYTDWQVWAQDVRCVWRLSMGSIGWKRDKRRGDATKQRLL